jgi:hypothetical protein
MTVPLQLVRTTSRWELTVACPSFSVLAPIQPPEHSFPQRRLAWVIRSARAPMRLSPSSPIWLLTRLPTIPTAPDQTAICHALLLDGDRFLVVDAGANALFTVTMTGVASMLAVFPPLMTPAPPFSKLPPGTEIPAQAVPTSVVKGSDDAYYVTELTGFPLPGWRCTHLAHPPRPIT